MSVLTAIDVVGIQRFIYASNRLRDVVGASYLVEWATRGDAGLRLSNGDVPAPEVIVAAGGNAILRFDTIDSARRFVLHYSRRLLEEAPGLDVAIAHFECQKGELARGLLALQLELAKAKLNRRPHAPQRGLGVMQPCATTGLPASGQDQYGKWVSARIGKIRSKALQKSAKKRWNAFLPSVDDEPSDSRCFAFPDEFDQMGRTLGDTSLIGVVHVDGNAIGKRIQSWLVGKLDNAAVADEFLIDEYQQWSEGLRKLGEGVLQRVVDRLTRRIEHDSEKRGFVVRGQSGPQRELDFELRTDGNGTILLPLRPILLGGDDITFVCDGRIALDLATTALRAFPDLSHSSPDLRPLGDEPVTACAGVALVHAHAPFHRSYELCEGLCAIAKREREAGGADLNDGCWIDWHIGAIRPGEPVTKVRQRQYQEGILTCRPYPLNGDWGRRLTWEWLDSELLGEPASNGSGKRGFRNPAIWGESRNKAKTLSTLVGQGHDAVREELAAWNSVAPEIALPRPIAKDGFKGNHTPLLDAVELLDLHLRLDSPEEPPRGESERDEGGA